MKRGAPAHPKLAKLAKLLGIRKREAVGIVELLHHFTDEYAWRGDVGKFDDEEIAARVDWEAGPGVLIDALVSAGLVDPHGVHRLVVHDWQDHAPEYTRKKVRGNAEKIGPGWAVHDVGPDPQPEDSGKFQNIPENSRKFRSSMARQGKARQGKARQGSGATAPPAALTGEQISRLEVWLSSRGWEWYSSRLRVEADDALAWHRGQGNRRKDWLATIQTWISKDIKRLIDDPRHAAVREQITQQTRREIQHQQSRDLVASAKAAKADEPQPPLDPDDFGLEVLDGGAAR